MSGSMPMPYRITTETFEGRVTAHGGSHVLADTQAAKVMQETRLQPAIYFPKSSVDPERLKRSSFRTFCPFKGTASYWDLDLGGEILPNAVWSYEQPLEEGRDVARDFGFMANPKIKIESSTPLPAARDDGHASGPLIDWLLRQAAGCATPEELTHQLGEKLIANGMPLWRIRVAIWTLHPLLAGQTHTWMRGSKTVETMATPHKALLHPGYLNSPVRHVTDGLGGVRQRLDVDEMEFDFPVIAELKHQGATDYVAMPLFFSDGSIQTVTLTSDDPQGFSIGDLGPVFEGAAVIGRFYEVMTLRSNSESLLDTYLGHRTGGKVLAGQIQRGDREDIRAAILFCDLRDSSGWLERLPRDKYLRLLNYFFETGVTAINAHGGEVLKFIGDAVLAIFPAEHGEAAASARAVSAARDIVEKLESERPKGASAPIDCAIGIHFGNVTYGNVGSPDRLDFTATGKAANIAARLADLGKDTGHKVVVSGQVAEKGGAEFRSIGTQKLHGISEEVEVFLPRF